MNHYLNIDAEKKLANRLYYGGGYTKKYEGGGLTPEGGDLTLEEDEARKDKRNAIMGAGLTVASSAIEAIDDDPSYGNADVAASTLKYASMGAVAGPWGAAAGAAVGFGVGMVQKGKAQKAEVAANHKAEQDEGYQNSMDALNEFAGYKDGGLIKKYASGGEIDSKNEKVDPPVNLDTTTKEGLKNYTNAYRDGSLTTKHEIDGEDVFAFSDMESIDIIKDRSDPNTAAESKEYTDFLSSAKNGAEYERKGLPVTAQQKEDSEYYKQNRPIEHSMAAGDEFSDMMEDFGTTVATAPLLMGSGAGRFLTKNLGGALKYEFATAKAGLNLMKNGQLFKGGVQTLYHGSKLQALPMGMAALGGLARDGLQGDATSSNLADMAKVGVNIYNPLKKIPYAGKLGEYMVENSKDLVKASADFVKGKYSQTTARLASTFVKDKTTKKIIKLGKGSLEDMPLLDFNSWIPTATAKSTDKTASGSKSFANGGMTQGAYNHG